MADERKLLQICHFFSFLKAARMVNNNEQMTCFPFVRNNISSELRGQSS